MSEQDVLNAQAAARSGVILTNGSTLRPEPVNWLWEGWIACGKFHILGGAPGQGKTTLMLAMAAAITCGGRWPDGSRAPQGNVVVWSGEDDPRDTLLPRLLAMSADPSRVYFLTGMREGDEERSFDPSTDMLQLTAEMEKIGDVKLLIIDPIVSAVQGDDFKNNQVRRSLKPVVDLADATGCAVVGITHFGKSTAGRDPTERLVGSVGYAALARVVMAAAKSKPLGDEAERRILVRTKSNIGPDDGGFEYRLRQTELDAFPGVTASCVEFGAAIDGTARDLLADAEALPDNDGDVHLNDAADFMRKIMTDVLGKSAGPMESREVDRLMKAEGYTTKAIRRARESLGIVIKRTGFGEQTRTFWTLPDGPLMPTSATRAHVPEWARVGTNGARVADASRFDDTVTHDEEAF
ncbi:MAG TPA: AAA family ATPase [Burkholderiaceae bacterium]